MGASWKMISDHILIIAVGTSRKGEKSLKSFIFPPF